LTIETITSNSWFSFISLAVTTASLVAAVIFYRKSRRDKIPCYSVRRQSIIENSASLLPGLSVHFSDVVQQSITVAKVSFWNHGAETINSQDIAEAKPLVIIVNGGVEVLNGIVLKRTDGANQFRIGEPQKQENGTTAIPITFDFLDRGDGALVQVVHNGDEETRVWVEGRIKGVIDQLRQISLAPNQDIHRKMGILQNSRSFMLLTFSVYLAMGLGLLFGGLVHASIAPNTILTGVFLVGASAFGFIILLARRSSVPSAISPVNEESLPQRREKNSAVPEQPAKK